MSLKYEPSSEPLHISAKFRPYPHPFFFKMLFSFKYLHENYYTVGSFV